jgi:hypothetical protein
MSNKILYWMKNQTKIFSSINFLLPNFFIPLGFLLIYSYFLLFFLPAGVNRIFFSKVRILFPPYIILSIFFILFLIKRNHTYLLNQEEKITILDLFLLIFPLTPVIQYMLNNMDILSWQDSILIICFFLLLVSLPILIIPFLLRKLNISRSLMSMGLAFTFTVTFMVSLSRQFNWYEVGHLRIQLPVLFLTWLIIWFTFRIRARKYLYMIVTVLFVSNTFFHLFINIQENIRTNTSTTRENINNIRTLIDSKQMIIKPDIYLLIYDSYTSQEILSSYGIDNNAQEKYIKNLGFKLYPNMYSVGPTTLTSMSRILEMSDEVGNMYNRRSIISGNGVVQQLFDGFGYQTYGIFPTDYLSLEVNPTYDYFYPPKGNLFMGFSNAILMGEFRFDINFSHVSHGDFVNIKTKIFSETTNTPRFIYTHTDLPVHSQNSGVCLPNETELYAQRLEEANLEMKNDLDSIMKNHSDAIIIIAGDHGPYLTKNCFDTSISYDISQISRLDIQDRYGAFLAIKWPSSGYEAYDQITILQDIFPAIFAFLFNDVELLNSRIVFSTLSSREIISEADVVDGIIRGGIDDGKPLFANGEIH